MPETETVLDPKDLTGNPNGNEAAKPVEITTSTGQVYRGANYQEVAEQIARAQENATALIRQQREHEQELMRQLAEAHAARQVQQAQSKASPAIFDKDAWWTRAAGDPVSAVKEIIDMVAPDVIAQKFGVDSFDDLKENFNYAYDRSKDYDQNKELAAFYGNNTDYPGGDNVGELMTKRCVELGFGQYGPVRAHEFETAYNQLVREGAVKPLAKPQHQEEQVQRRRAMPSDEGEGTQSIPGLTEDKIRKMDLPEIEELVKKLGMK